jgi:hypothetical protein
MMFSARRASRNVKGIRTMGSFVVVVRSLLSQIREATVETHTPPDGKRLLNSPYMRAMPPRSGGKSCVRNKILQVGFTLDSILAWSLLRPASSQARKRNLREIES